MKKNTPKKNSGYSVTVETAHPHNIKTINIDKEAFEALIASDKMSPNVTLHNGTLK